MHSWLFSSPDWYQRGMSIQNSYNHRLIKTQIGHARDFTWYRGQRPSPARVILSHERVQIQARENLCSKENKNPPHFRELLLCDILITRAGDGRWPRYQAKSLACPGCGYNSPVSHSARHQRPARERHKIRIASRENVDNQAPCNTNFTH